MTTLAQPIVREDGVTLFMLAQEYLEDLLDRWAVEAHRGGTYTPAGHGHLFGLVDYAGRLDDTLKAGGLPPDRLAQMEFERNEVCTVTIATMRALKVGHSLGEIVGEGV